MSDEAPSENGGERKLTRKQRLFVDEYLRDYNATRAATDAGYSPKTAYSIGWENLRKPEIKAAIDEKSMGRDEVLLRLADIARGDMGDFLAIGSMGFEVDLNNAKELGLTRLIRKVKMRTTISSSKDGGETEVHDMEVELYDALGALVQLGRHHKLFTDRQETVSRTYRVTMDGEELIDE